jgi:hypothetical protein
MNRIIGFDRKLQLDWLNATVGLCQENPDPNVIAEHLRLQLASEIGGTEARRKTITVLLRIWVNVPTEYTNLRDEALQLASQISPQERLWLHWGMSLLAYPFFRDVAATVGQLSRLQGTLSQAQVQRRMIENWGQRTTLQRAVRRLLRTFIDWNVLQETDVRGSYEVAPPQRTENQFLALWLLECTLWANGSETPLTTLVQSPQLFPFDLTPYAGSLRQSDRFVINREGLDLEMVALADRAGMKGLDDK